MSKILIVDDRVTNRRILAQLAATVDADIEVDTFDAPAKALACAKDASPDLVVTDFNMPGMNGAAFVQRFRQLPWCQDVPVIVVTAYEDKEFRYRALDAGATDFLLSPVDHHEFATRVRNLLTLRRQRLARVAAERANQAKTDFLANMSHELRTPLNAIIGFAEMIELEMLGPVGNDKYREYSADIRNSATHLRAVIQSILDMTRIEQQQLEIEAAPFDLRRMLERVIQSFAPEIERSGLNLSTSVPVDLPHLLADDEKVRQVFTNLISNAVKFTPKGGRIRVAARVTSGGAMEVRVSDTGIGMAEQDIEIATMRFGQVHGHPMKKKYPGTGLGLPLSIGLVEVHGGTVSIDSRLGEGTEVTVRFPSSRVLTSRKAS